MRMKLNKKPGVEHCVVQREPGFVISWYFICDVMAEKHVMVIIVIATLIISSTILALVYNSDVGEYKCWEEAKSNPKFWANHRSLQPAVNSTAEKTQDCSQPSLPQESSQYLPWNLGNNHHLPFSSEQGKQRYIEANHPLRSLCIEFVFFIDPLTIWHRCFFWHQVRKSKHAHLLSSDNITYGVFRREIGILFPPLFHNLLRRSDRKFFSHKIISTAGVCCQPTYSGGTVSLCRDQVAQLTSENPQQLTHQRASKDI